MGTRIVLGAILTTLVLVFATLAWAFFEMFYPFKDLEYLTRPLPVVNKPLHPGDVAKIDVHYCRTSDRPIQVFGELREVNKNYIIQVGDKTRNLPRGCPNRIVSQIWPIPNETPSGIYVYHWSIIDHKSVIRNVYYEADSEPFEVK